MIAEGTGTDLVALRVRATDLPAAERLYATVLGGVALEADEGLRRWWFPPAMVIEVAASDAQPGPRELVLASPDLAGAAQQLQGRGVSCVMGDEGLEIDDPRIGGGQVRVVRDDHPLATAARCRVASPPPGGTAGVASFDHACLGVPDVVVGPGILADGLGGNVVLGGDSPWGARALQVSFPSSKLELLSPLRPDGPVGAFLARRGGRAGVHHVTLLVDDVHVAAAACEAAGFGVVDTDTSAATWHETFVRPRAAQGLLIQLAWTDLSYDRPLAPEVLADVLAGRYVATSHVMRHQGGST